MPQDFRELDAMLAKARGKREPGAPVIQDVALTDRPCPGCGYSLKGLPLGGRCPECGLVQQRNVGGGISEHAGRRSAWVGGCLAAGWVVMAVGWMIAWAGYALEQTLFAVPREMMGVVGGVIVVVGAGLAAMGTLVVVWLEPDEVVRRSHAAWVRVLVVATPLAWAAAGACCAIGSYLELPTAATTGGVTIMIGGAGTSLWVIPVIFVAGLLSGAYGRVMSLVADTVDDSVAQRRLEMATVGAPLGVAVFCFGAWFAELANWVWFANYLVAMFVTLLGWVLLWGLVMGMRGLGMGLWWAKKNLEGAAGRDRRRIERWQKRAEQDKEKERKFGNSVGH